RKQFGQPVIGLWAYNDVHRRLPSNDFGAFSLGNATRNSDEHGVSTFRPLRFQLFQTTEFRIDFLSRFFPDVASIQYDQVCRFAIDRRCVTGRGQDIRYSRGVVHIHLATISLDVEFLHFLFRGGGGQLHAAFSLSSALLIGGRSSEVAASELIPRSARVRPL